MEKRLPNKDFRQLVILLKDPKEKEKIYPSQEERKINWPAYNLTKIREASDMLMFIRELVNKSILPSTKGKRGKPLTNPKSLAKAILACELLGLPERNAQDWIAILSSQLGIKELLDDRVIGEAYDKPEVACILKQVFDHVRKSDGILSGDGTGLERSRKENYASTKSKEGTYMTSIVDSREVVQAFDISGVHECQIMHELVKEVRGDSLRLDAGFNDRALATEIEELFMTPYIYPKKCNNLNGDLAWKFMYLEFFFDVYFWLKEYHQRSHCESFHSSFKRVFGLVTKVRYSCRFAQITARIILHNLQRLSYFARAK
jgi:transposase